MSPVKFQIVSGLELQLFDTMESSVICPINVAYFCESLVHYFFWPWSHTLHTLCSLEGRPNTPGAHLIFHQTHFPQWFPQEADLMIHQ